MLWFSEYSVGNNLGHSWWHHCPGFPDDRLHNGWTPDPQVLSDKAEDEWEPLVKREEMKSREIERRDLKWLSCFISSEAVNQQDSELSPAACDEYGLLKGFKCFSDKGMNIKNKEKAEGNSMLMSHWHFFIKELQLLHLWLRLSGQTFLN